MPPVTFPQTFELALQHHRAGRLAEAEALYRQVLAVQPRHADSLHLLGVINYQAGRHGTAVDLIGAAIAIAPDQAAFHSNLGNALGASGRMDEAIAAYRRAVQLQPDFADAQYNLGTALKARGDVDGAIAAYRRTVELRPDFAEGHHHLGIALHAQGKWEEAVAAYGQALQIRPDSADVLVNLGTVLCEEGRTGEAITAYSRAIGLQPDLAQAHQNLGHALNIEGRFDEAIAASRRAIQLRPDFAVSHNNLAIALNGMGRADEAIASYRRAIEASPGLAEIHSNLADSLRNQGRLDEALAASRRAIQLKPDYAPAHHNLANVLKDGGRLAEAVAACRRAIQLRPDFAEAHSSLLFMPRCLPGFDWEELLREHRRWDELHARPLGKFITAHGNDRDPGRRLRIGYVSPDFRSHVIAQFLTPLLEAHDHAAWEIFCYASVLRPDAITARLRRSADVWRDVLAVNDAALARQIREDRIDILVDLTQHLANNRLLAFARKPAPVQVAWLGYPGSTGVKAMDWRITDAWMEPPGAAWSQSVEKVARLPDSWFCFDPLDGYPPPGELPALGAGHVTFGCLNNFCKVNDAVLHRWAGVMRAVEGSRLILQCPEGETRARVRGVMESQGVAAERLELVGHLPRAKFLRLFGRMDMVLDPFPYNGGTTTCEALWMGIPVLTQPGELALSRIGLSILMACGMPEFLARTEDEYVRLAAGLAGDLPRLAGLRATLRGRMKCSAFMDAPRFARNMEAAYRQMWRAWCAEPCSDQAS